MLDEHDLGELHALIERNRARLARWIHWAQGQTEADTLAFIQSQNNDNNAAATTLKTAIQLEPDVLDWKVRMARVLVDGGHPREAQQHAPLPSSARTAQRHRSAPRP